MEKEDKIFEKFKLKRCLTQSMDYLISLKSSEEEFGEAVNKLIKTLLPDCDYFFTSIAWNYAIERRKLFELENILDDVINKYCGGKNDNGMQN